MLKCSICIQYQKFKCEICFKLLCPNHAGHHLKSNRAHSVQFNEDTFREDFNKKLSARKKTLKFSKQVFFSYKDWSDIESIILDINDPYDLTNPTERNLCEPLSCKRGTFDEPQKKEEIFFEEVKEKEIKNEAKIRPNLRLKLNINTITGHSREEKPKKSKIDKDVGKINIEELNNKTIEYKRKKLSRYNIKDYSYYFVKLEWVSVEIRFTYKRKYAFVCKIYLGILN